MNPPRLLPAPLTEEDRCCWIWYACHRWPGVHVPYEVLWVKSMQSDRRDADLMLKRQQTMNIKEILVGMGWAFFLSAAGMVALSRILECWAPQWPDGVRSGVCFGWSFLVGYLLAPCRRG